MTCEQVRELLGNYIDEELTGAMRSVIDTHCAACRACREDLATLFAVVQRTQDESAEAPSEWFTERLLDRLARDSDIAELSPRIGSRLQLPLWET